MLILFVIFSTISRPVELVWFVRHLPDLNIVGLLLMNNFAKYGSILI